MKLVILGLTLSSSWGNGHATLWRGLLRALAGRGHRVVFFERDAPWYATHRDLAALEGTELVIYGAWDEVRQRVRREFDSADAGIVTSYCPDGLAGSALLLESRARRRVFYDLDTPVTLDRLEHGEDVPWLGPRGLADFDLVLSYTGGGALDELRTRLGARAVAPLYGSVDPAVHHPVAPVAEWRCDLSYLGTYAADRQAALERLLIATARRLPRRRFLLGGSTYPPDFPWTENLFYVRHVPPPEHPAFYGSSRWTLNVTRGAMAAMGWCPSGRLFESAACGTPIVSDGWPGLDEFFAPGREILVAHDTGDVVDALGMDEAERLRIADAARERTLEQHSADRRARELEERLASIPAAVPAEPAATSAARKEA